MKQMDKPMDIQKIKILREKLRILERESMGVFDAQQECCGLTLSQCHTLIEIGMKGEISLVELASALGLDASTLSRTIQGMVIIGLVRRTTNEQDRRFVSISLTEQGRKVYDEIDAVYNGFLTGVFELLPGDKHDRILEDIGLFVEAVRNANEKSACCPKGKKA
jgi:DNA-binding MarR family transcriptional regulator